MSKEKDLMTPIAIVVAGAIIALAVYFSITANKQNAAGNNANTPQKAPVVKVRTPQKDDLIKGSKNAPVVVIEYSDTECPFCKNYHDVMNRIVKDYKGKVAWVYRFFPLPQLHPKAEKEARAVACAYKLKGNDAAFKYLDRIMEITPSNNGLDLSKLPEVATYVGLDKAAFQKCLDSGETKSRVSRDSNEAIKSGAKGTPHNVILYKGEQMVVPGGLPYERLKLIIDQLLKDNAKK